MRFLSAGNFLLLIGLFFLPWIDMRCEMAGQGMSIAYQSGNQAAAGEFSEGQLLREERAEARREERRAKTKAKAKKVDEPENQEGMPGNPGEKKKEKKLRDMINANEKLPAAPLLYGHLGFLCAGVLASLLMPRGIKWRWCVAVCVMGALLIVGVQIAIGFPIETKVSEGFQQWLDEKEERDAEADKELSVLVTKRFLFPFYLVFLFGATGLFCVYLDVVLNSSTRKKRGDKPPVAEDVRGDDSDENPFQFAERSS